MAQFPSTTSAYGVWTLQDVRDAVRGNNWPSAPLPVTPDPNFNRVSLLLNGDGPDGGQNNTYTDSSAIGHTMTPAGTLEQGSVSPFGANWANYFGAGEKIYTGQSSGLAFGTGDFTVETWVYRQADIKAYSRAWQFGPYWNNNDSVTLLFDDGAFPNKITFASYRLGGRLLVSTTSVVSGQWYHVAVTRESGTFKLWIDGVLEDTDTTAGATEASSTNLICVASAYDRDVQEDFDGFISNLRVVKGTAVYTSDFTPPTEPLTAISGTQFLSCQSNRFVDNSTNALAFTIAGTPEATSFSPLVNSAPITLADNGGSVFVNGLGARLTTTESLGSGDFTVEFWAYTINAQDDAYFETRVGVISPTGLTFTALDSDTVRLYDNAARVTVNGVSYLNQWVHFAIERSSGTLTIYVNGQSGGSAANTTNYSDSTFIVGDSNQYGDTDAYISNFRLVKGSAVYGGNFTPPTEPLTAVTNTALLLNFADAAIFDYTALNNVNTVGNADISTAVVKYGTGSLAFDGTGDYLDLPVNPTLSFGTGDFTIEGWMNVASIDGTYRCIMLIGAPVQVYSRNGTIECYFNDTDNTSGYIVTNLQGPASSITANTWHYFTVVRNGTTFTAYVDGVAGTPITGVTAAVATSATGASIGLYSVTGQYPFTGYMDDFRITKGLARYTANFTPPEAALPTF